MARDSSKRLFHVIVVAGAALGGCGGKSGEIRGDASEYAQDAQQAGDGLHGDDTAADVLAEVAEPVDAASAADSPSDARDQDVRFPHIVM
jgi:hypothetical protein